MKKARNSETSTMSKAPAINFATMECSAPMSAYVMSETTKITPTEIKNICQANRICSFTLRLLRKYQENDIPRL
jgi:hypothetical protein